MALGFCQSLEIFTKFSLDSRKEQHRYDVESTPLFQCNRSRSASLLPSVWVSKNRLRAAYVTTRHFVLCEVYTIEYSMNAFAVEERKKQEQGEVQEARQSGECPDEALQVIGSWKDRVRGILGTPAARASHRTYGIDLTGAAVFEEDGAAYLRSARLDASVVSGGDSEDLKAPHNWA